MVMQADLLSVSAKDAIRTADRLGVSAISCWEVGMLAEKGRLKLDRPTGAWVQTALRWSRVVALPVTSEIAVAAATFPPGFHGDPADRIIAATASIHGAPLVTRD